MTRIFGLHVPFTAYETPPIVSNAAAPAAANGSASPARVASPDCEYPEEAAADNESQVEIAIPQQQQQQAPASPESLIGRVVVHVEPKNDSPKPQERPLAQSPTPQEQLREPLLPKSHFEHIAKEEATKRNALMLNTGLLGVRLLLTFGLLYVACSSRQTNSLRIVSGLAIVPTNAAFMYLTKRVNHLISLVEFLNQKRDEQKPPESPPIPSSPKDYFVLKA